MGKPRYFLIVMFFVFMAPVFLLKTNICLAAGKTAKNKIGYTVNKEELSAGTLKNLRLFSKVYSLIKNNYIKKESSKKLVFGAVEGMVSTLDPHTYFLTPDEFRQMRSETSGEFTGIGIKISTKKII